jgi:hypothetical protein
MRRWLLALTVFLALLVLGGVALAQYAQDYNGCPPEARVSVDKPLCLWQWWNTRAVTGRVTGTACGDAAVTIRHTSLCYGINDRLVGAGRTTANGAFTIPLSETLRPGSYTCSAWIDVDVECACGPVRVREHVYTPRTTVPATIPVPLAGGTTLSGQWDCGCAGLTVTVKDAAGNVLGTGIIQSDGSFVVHLSRSLRSGEVITVISICGPNTLWEVLGPIAIPEAGTWLLLGAGLAGVAGYVGLRWRARQ